MKIIIEDLAPNEEETCIIRVKSVTDNITRALNLLKSPDAVTVFSEDGASVIDTREIYYIESVDMKTFVYTKTAVFQSRLRLYELEELLASGDFLRISKQTIVNVPKIREISPAGGGRFTALLDNSEKVIIARSFVPVLKRRFGL
jgi:DNA-binding LytR/AlgR family response regulator